MAINDVNSAIIIIMNNNGNINNQLMIIQANKWRIEILMKAINRNIMK